MAYAVLNHVRIAGVASCVPANVVSNLQCAPERLSERERLVRNIGIAYRRQADAGQCFSDLAQRAAEDLMAQLGWRPEEVDAIVVVTQSPDYPFPGTAVLLQDRLGLPNACLAFDINLGCSGYPYGLFVVGSMIEAGKLRKALLVVGDKSTNPDSQDQGFAVLFSDAGTATALEYREDAAPAYFDLYTDGAGYQAIYCPAGGNRNPLRPEHLVATAGEDGIVRRQTDLRLDGPAILNFSITRIPPAVESLLDRARMTADQVDWFLFHQANRIINETIRKKLRLPAEKTPSTLHDFGNTSSASIPLTLTMHAAPAIRAGRQRLLMSGFGVGLSWASCIVDIDADAAVPPLIEV
ncbi:MAG: ketoacyl-ACP synthase III [Burkholderiaceae bacterium]